MYTNNIHLVCSISQHILFKQGISVSILLKNRYTNALLIAPSSCYNYLALTINLFNKRNEVTNMKKIKLLLALSLALCYVCCILNFTKTNSEHISGSSIKFTICDDKTTLPPVNVNSYTPKKYQASLGLNTLS